MTASQHLTEIQELEQRLRDAEATINYLRADKARPPLDTPDKLTGAAGIQDAAFQALVEGVREGAAVLSADGAILFCNRRLSEILNLECGQMDGLEFTSFLTNDDQPRFKELLQSNPIEFTKLSARLSGGNIHPVPAELAIKSIGGIGKGSYGLLVTDLRRRRRAEERIAFQAFLLGNVYDAVLAMDEQLRITFWNSAAEQLYGWTADEVLGRLEQDVVRPELVSAERTELERRLSEQGRVTHQHLQHHRDGTSIHIETRRSALRSAEGAVIGYVAINRDITQQKRAEEHAAQWNVELTRRVAERTTELERSSRRIGEILESIQDGFLALDRDWHFVYVNQTAARNAGASAQDLIGQNLWEKFPGLLGTPVEAHYRQVMTERVPARFETKGIVTGSIYDVHVAPSAEGISVYSIDIAERQQMEKDLAWLASFPRLNPSPVTEVDLDGTIHFVNPFAEQVLPDLRQKGVEHPWLTEWSSIGRALRKGRMIATRREIQVGQNWYLQTLSYVPETRRIRIYGVDITERKNAEESLREAMRALQESERHYRGLFDTMLQGVVYQAADGTVLSMNPAATQILGKTRSEFHGKGAFAAETDTLREDGTPFPSAEHPSAVALRTGREVRDVLMRVYNPEQHQYRLINVTAVPVFRDGELLPYQVYTVLDDVTQRKQTEIERERLLAENQRRAADLEYANKELESFSYSVSHDLRTPLSSIQNLTRIVLDEDAAQLPPTSLAYLQLIHENARAMEQLILGLLDFSRTGRQPLHKQIVSQSTLVRQVWDELAAARAGRHIELTDGALPDVAADPILLKQVWVNLLSNAIKFTRQREIARIEIGSRRDGDVTICFVKDNGAGFDMEQADNLFGVFRRLHSEDEFEGTGVGLAIVEHIIRRHGGRIWADAQVDRGASFYFTLE